MVCQSKNKLHYRRRRFNHYHHHHHHWVLINVQVQEHIPHQCTLQVIAHRAVLTLGKTAICIFVAKFYCRIPFLSPTQKLSAVQDVRLNLTDFGCVLHRCHHELVVLFCWTSATEQGSQPVDSYNNCSFDLLI